MTIQLQLSVSLTQIVEVPIIPPKTSKRKIIKKKSIFLQARPLKINQKKRKIKKEQKKEKTKKKKKLQKYQRKKTEIKRLKRDGSKSENEETKRVLKKFTNIKEFSDSSQEKKEGKDETVDDYCIFCCDKYIDPPDEDWIMCSVCENWAHEKCTDANIGGL